MHSNAYRTREVGRNLSPNNRFYSGWQLTAVVFCRMSPSGAILCGPTDPAICNENSIALTRDLTWLGCISFSRIYSKSHGPLFGNSRRRYPDGRRCLVVIICAIPANYLLAEAVQRLPAATVYAAFAGIGTAGTAIVGMVFLARPRVSAESAASRSSSSGSSA